MPKIVVFDGYTLNPGDLSWEKLKELGDIAIYDRTPNEKLAERGKDADIIVINKQIIGQEELNLLPNVQFICISATGTNNVDFEATKARNILVSNVRNYGTPAVAQHVFAMLLQVVNGIKQHDQDVKNGGWSRCPDFSYHLFPITELNAKTLGIYGFGQIGQAVAKIGQAFGMKIIAHHKHPERDAKEGVQFVDLDTLFQESDVLSLHAPLTAHNKSIINRKNLQQMKSSAILINTGRGGLVHEEDLFNALQQRTIHAAALDVLTQEPPLFDHPFYQLDNIILTPHNAWATQAARQRLLNGVIENIKAYLAGKPSMLVHS